jgi:DNA-binding PadR family transcriptional regulator
MHHHFFHRMRGCAADLEDTFFMGGPRGGGGGGFRRFAAGFMGGGGFGGPGFRFGRKLGSGDLQVVLLALLAERPSHGYELIKALEERSGGFYIPSPGMVYPALTWLEEVGYASVAAEGAKKLYTITAEGRAYLEKNQASADAVLETLQQIGRKMGRVREAFSGEGDEGDEDDRHGAFREIWAARRELKHALREKRRHLSPAEAKRIAEVLKRAAAEILGDEPK